MTKKIIEEFTEVTDEQSEVTDEQSEEKREPANDDSFTNINANYEKMLEGQQKQIDLLMKQNESLQGQISKLVSSGAQIDNGIEYKEPEETPAPKPDDYEPLSALGKEIGKRSTDYDEWFEHHHID